MPSRPQKPALGALAGIVGGALPDAGVSPTSEREPITKQDQHRPVKQHKQRINDPIVRMKDNGKMQTVYLHAQDLSRAVEVEYRVRRVRAVKGRVGLSLVVRAGLKLLADEMTKNEQRGIEAVASVASEE
jgi:hypothetical protein